MDAVYAIVMTTCDEAANAKTIAKSLVERRLAACVQIFPMESIYMWEGKVNEAAEFMLFCKIKRADYPDVEAAIRELHSYKVPEVIEVPIENGFADYLGWISSVTR